LGKHWDFSDIRAWDWRRHPAGAVIPDAGTAEQYVTGGWRSLRPILDREKCIDCFFCFIYCPDSSVMVHDGAMTGFDLQHCKGCGICAEECPKSAIAMVNEAEAQGLESCVLAGDEKPGEEKGA
jgi:pyruvate ferredoxin oxidoreductase delta subunit